MIGVTYEVRVSSPQEIDGMARSIAVEQTLEVPEALIRQHGGESMVGQIRDVGPLGENRYRVTIDYPESAASGQLPQLLNLLCGNVLILPHVRIVDFQLPDSLLARFPGPSFGVSGIRRMLCAAGRPLLATALKPRGLSSREYADMAHEFVRGGGDLIKDDHNIVDESLPEFLERVRLCQDRVAEAREATGANAIYLPFLSRPFEEIEEALVALEEMGVSGLLVAPMILGLDLTRSIAQRHPFVLMAHPSFSGSFYVAKNHGIDHELMLGTLFRLAGVDISVFPNVGGRFGFSREECVRIAQALRGALGGSKRSFPAPAGGMSPERFEDMRDTYGVDTVVLVGGALLEHSGDLASSTRHFRNQIDELF